MADENTGLLVSLEARFTAFEKALLRIEKKSAQSFGAVKAAADKNIAAVESTLARANAFERRMSAIDRGFAGFGRSLIPSLAAMSAALSVREIAAYADSWTQAKNALAIVGIEGEKQVQVLDKLYEAAQRQAAPLEALTSLYGRAAQSVSADQAKLLQFSEGVATALRVQGTSANEASGALTQLGQLIASNRVQAEEFNSINEQARPILIAVANGLDKAGGSVSKLRQLVIDGKVSGQEFFDAFLRGLPTIEKMAARSSTTIEQGVTRINNAFTKYVGQTDESLSASQRLVTGMTALADNFDTVADTSLKLASVLAGALVGRGIAGMLSTIPTAVSAMTALVAAMRAGTLTAAGFGAALGPLGLIAGAAAGAALAFGNWGDSIDDATRSLADQATSSAGVEAMIADLARAQDAYKAAIANTAGTQTSATNSIVADTEREFTAKKSLLELELKRQKALLAVQQASLSQQSAALKQEIGSQVFTRDSSVANGFSDPRVGDFVRRPDELTGLDKTRQVIENSPITAEIQKIRAEMQLTELGAAKLEEALNSTFSTGSGGKGAGAQTDTGSKKGGGSRINEYERLTQRIAEATAATIAETEAVSTLNPTVDDFGFSANKARVEQELLAAALKAGKEITPALKAEITGLAEAYAGAEAAAGRLSEAQSRAFDNLEEAKSITNSVFSDIRSALSDGKITWEEWGDIATNVLNKIIDKLQNQLVDALFSATSAASQTGNIFGSIFGSLFGGGSQWSLASSGSIFGLFDEGGWTGPGGKKQAAGVVHADEFVFTKKAVQRAGVGNLYRLMNYFETGNASALLGAGMPGYDGGGYVGSASLPSIPSSASMASSTWGNAADGDATVSPGSGGGGNTTVKIMLDKNLKAEILEEAAGNSVQIVSAAAPVFAEQTSNRIVGDFHKGKYDTGMAKYGVTRKPKPR